MEPIMMVTITANESDLGAVMHDLSSARGGQVISLDGDSSSPDDATSNTSDDIPDIDSAKIYAPADPFMAEGGGHVAASADRQRRITARVPLKEMVGYLKHLRSLTGGRGTFVMQVNRFEKMSAQRQKAVLNEMRGDYV
jgi:elongation factor G